MVDQLAAKYAGQPVLFLEQDVDNTVGSRYGRWWAAYPGIGTATLPMMMVDSGNQISNGFVSFADVYQGMVDTAQARPPQADISAYYVRDGADLTFHIQLTNQTGASLSSSENGATLHALVYEETRVALTGTFVRAGGSQPISTPLANDATGSYTVTVPAVPAGDWSKIGAVIIADYRPAGFDGPYDTLQAAHAAEASFSLSPDKVTFMADPADPPPHAVTLTMSGSQGLTYVISHTIPWLEVTPAAGPIDSPPALSLLQAQLSAGWQQGTVTVTATDGGAINFTRQLPVSAYLGEVERTFLPLAQR